MPDKCLKWEYFSVNLHKIVFTQRGISGQPHRFTSISIYLGNGKKGGKRLTYGGSELGFSKHQHCSHSVFKFCSFEYAVMRTL